MEDLRSDTRKIEPIKLLPQSVYQQSEIPKTEENTKVVNDI